MTKNPLDVMWQLVWSIPIAVLWVLMFGCVWIGWGPRSADTFAESWNGFIDRDYFRKTKGLDDAGTESASN